MKNSLFTLLFLSLALSGKCQVNQSVQTETKLNLFNDCVVNANSLHQLVIKGNKESINDWFKQNGYTLNDTEYFWEQLEESKQIFPSSQLLDSSNYSCSGNKRMFAYHYRYTNLIPLEQYVYSVYLICHSAEHTVDISFVRSVDIPTKNGAGIYDDFVYSPEKEPEQTPGFIYDDFILSNPKK